MRKKNYSAQKHRKVLQTKSFLIKMKFEFYIHTGNTEVSQMAQLWGGRFTKDTDQLVYNFNASISFDQKFFHQDIEGSIAHTVMLAKQKILTEEEKDAILRHMWPLTPVPPSTRAGYAVTFADKMCCVEETKATVRRLAAVPGHILFAQAAERGKF